MDTTLLHELPLASAERRHEEHALTQAGESMSYGQLAVQLAAFANGLLDIGLERGDRVAIYMEKRFEHVVASFGTAAAGGVFVPLNPLLKPDQVRHILEDSGARVLVTSPQRLSLLESTLSRCRDLRHVVVVGEHAAGPSSLVQALHRWADITDEESSRARRHVSDSDMAAILYTSGSTGRPKGVVLSHRNLVIGAKSVASYLQNTAEDTLLAALPFSFDAGFSQLTTAFHAGARVVLLNYVLPQDLLSTLERERVTGLTGVPPLYIQLAGLAWPVSIAQHLRYFANTGGHMPLATLVRLRALLPRTKPFLMYGLTEAFRATYLPPEEAERRPDSIGKAIPNAEVLVLRADGTPCAANEPGELVQRGPLVAMGYWNDPRATAERFRPLPSAVTGDPAASSVADVAVFSGDTVRRDEDGFLYFVGRRDEMIKTSGYRVSPTEVEEVLYATGLIGEAAAFGVPHPRTGQAIIVVATARSADVSAEALLAACRARLPAYMVPAKIEMRPAPLPRNPNGKIDRKRLSEDFRNVYFSDRP